MSLTERLEQLARIVPGVAGYQNSEHARDTDKNVRERLHAELETLQRELERDKRRLIEARDLTSLPALDGLAAKLDQLGKTVEYASRGYRAVFDTWKLDQTKLEHLCAFDLGLFDQVASLKTSVQQLHEALPDRTRLAGAIAVTEQALDRFESTFARRQGLFTEG
jgi:hypothetical protein